MKYVLTDNSRVDFIARAPLHAFKGWAVEGVQVTLEANFSAGILQSLAAEVETGCFDTADPDRTEAMSRYFSLAEHPHASFALSQCQEIVLRGGRVLAGPDARHPLLCRYPPPVARHRDGPGGGRPFALGAAVQVVLQGLRVEGTTPVDAVRAGYCRYQSTS